MAKSTVDLQLWLDELTDELFIQRIETKRKPHLALELFNDGSFRIVEHGGKDKEEVEILISGEDLDTASNRDITIHDLPYMNAGSLAEKIIENEKASKFSGTEL